jgi:hypothetical protein
VYQIASLFLLQRLKGTISGDAYDFNNIEMRAVIKFFFPARQGAEGNVYETWTFITAFTGARHLSLS